MDILTDGAKTSNPDRTIYGELKFSPVVCWAVDVHPDSAKLRVFPLCAEYYPPSVLNNEDDLWKIVPANPGFFSVDLLFNRQLFPNVEERAANLGIKNPEDYTDWEAVAREWVEDNLQPEVERG